MKRTKKLPSFHICAEGEAPHQWDHMHSADCLWKIIYMCPGCIENAPKKKTRRRGFSSARNELSRSNVLSKRTSAHKIFA